MKRMMHVGLIVGSVVLIATSKLLAQINDGGAATAGAMAGRGVSTAARPASSRSA